MAYTFKQNGQHGRVGILLVANDTIQMANLAGTLANGSSENVASAVITRILAVGNWTIQRHTTMVFQANTPNSSVNWNLEGEGLSPITLNATSNIVCNLVTGVGTLYLEVRKTTQ